MDTSFDHHAVLLVEDNEDDAFLMKSAWKSAGNTNRMPVVSNGEEALDYLRGNGEFADREKHPFPVAIFLDLKMPRMDGLEVLAAIRGDTKLKHLHVDILSASARTADVEKALELGANSYIVKPSRVDDLVAMVRAWKTLATYKMFVLPV